MQNGSDTGSATPSGGARPERLEIWAYVVPYLAFGVILAVRDGVGAHLAPLLLVAQVAVPAGLLLFYWAQGEYPELAKPRGRLHAWLGDGALGLAIATLWIGPFLLFPGLPRPTEEAGFDAAVLGSNAASLALRFLGFALVTPFMEELFVRSFLLRFLDVFDTDADFRSVPIGRFAWRSFLGTVVWFTVTHQTWEWIVALPTGVLLNLWLYRRRRMGSVILAHAVANAAIFAFVVLQAGEHPDLWIFL